MHNMIVPAYEAQIAHKFVSFTQQQNQQDYYIDMKKYKKWIMKMKLALLKLNSSLKSS